MKNFNIEKELNNGNRVYIATNLNRWYAADNQKAAMLQGDFESEDCRVITLEKKRDGRIYVSQLLGKDGWLTEEDLDDLVYDVHRTAWKDIISEADA